MKEFEKEPLTSFLRTLSLEQKMHIRSSLCEYEFEFINKKQISELIDKDQLYGFLFENNIIDLYADGSSSTLLLNHKPFEDLVGKYVDFFINKQPFSEYGVYVYYKYTNSIVNLMYDLFLSQIDDYCSIEYWAERLNYRLDHSLFENKVDFLKKKYIKIFKKITTSEDEGYYFQKQYHERFNGKLLKNSIQEFKPFFYSFIEDTYKEEEDLDITYVEYLISNPDFDINFDNEDFIDFIKYEINTRKLHYIKYLINKETPINNIKKQTNITIQPDSDLFISDVAKELFSFILLKFGVLNSEGIFKKTKIQPYFDAIWKVHYANKIEEKDFKEKNKLFFKTIITFPDYVFFLKKDLKIKINKDNKLSDGSNYVDEVHNHIEDFYKKRKKK